MNWLQRILVRRLSQESNVFLVETTDKLRILQLMELRKDYLKYTHSLFSFLYDVQRNRLILVDEKKVINTREHPLTYLDEELRHRKTFALLKIVSTREEALQILPALVAWAHDDDILSSDSLVIVVIASKTLIPDHLYDILPIITPPLPSINERQALIEKAVKIIEHKYTALSYKKVFLATPEEIRQASILSSGLNLYETYTATLESLNLYKRIEPTVFLEKKIRKLKAHGLEYIEPERGFETVGGYDYIKNYIKNRIIKILRNPQLAEYYGIQPPRGILLVGSPGTGKTWLSLAMSKELQLPVVKLKASDFLRKYVGESERMIRYITMILEEMAPIVAYFDEFDQLAISRTSYLSTDSGVMRRIQNMLLDWMGNEKRKTIIIGSTNLPEQIDDAFLRPGRIDIVIPVLPPDYKSRVEILKIHTSVIRSLPLAEDVDLEKIAEKTEYWTGAHLERLVKEASYLAMEEDSKLIHQEHFIRAMKKIRVDTEKMKNDMIRIIKVLEHLGNTDQEILDKIKKQLKRNNGKRPTMGQTI